MNGAPTVYAKLNLIAFPMHVDRMSMEFPILYLKGPQVEISKKKFFVLTNSADPDEMAQ